MRGKKNSFSSFSELIVVVLAAVMHSLLFNADIVSALLISAASDTVEVVAVEVVVVAVTVVVVDIDVDVDVEVVVVG